MKYTRLLIAALALSTVSMPIAGCAPLQTIAQSTTTPPCTTTVADDKARWGAEAAYNVVASAYRSANERDLFEGRDELKETIKSKLQLMAGYLRGVRSAHQVCDSVTLLSYKAGMDKLEAEVLPLIPGR